MSRRLHGLVLAAAAGLGLLAAPRAQAAPLTVTQTVRHHGSSYAEGDGSFTASYTAVTAERGPWRGRASLGWWWWRSDAAGLPADDAGPGSLSLTAGRRLLDHAGPGRSTRVWLQLRAGVPLQDEPTVGGSGEFDWGGSVLAVNRLGRFVVFAEAGWFQPGDPPAYSLDDRLSLAVSASWHPRGLPVYPLAGYVAATGAAAGEPAYGEWSAGLGAVFGRRWGLSVLATGGTAASGPGTGAMAVISVRP